MSSAPRSRAFFPAIAIAVATSLAPSVGCSEQLPRPFDDAAAGGGETRNIGLDLRPTNESCRGRATLSPTPSPGPKPTMFWRQLNTELLSAPVQVIDSGERLYVVDQHGYLRYLMPDGTTRIALDLHDQVNFGFDTGMLSAAFHPSFAQNGYVYLTYTEPYPTDPPPAGFVFQGFVGRFTSTDGGLTFDPATEKRLIVHDQPGVNHNVDQVAFGPDGYLYVAIGDGTVPVEDHRSQDPYETAGKFLRIDVDGGDPYAIPPDNPYAQGGGRPEVYAIGMRNPWRFSFDSATGDLWAGDVGALAREEIDKIVLGGNYGWPYREGKICGPIAPCDVGTFVEPFLDYDRTVGNTIIGGVVYHGKALPQLAGKYIYGDAPSRKVWAVDPNDPTRTSELIIQTDGIVSYSIDRDGEILGASYSGKVLRLEPVPETPETPTLLSASGCVQSDDPRSPAPGLFPYDVNVPQWLNGTTASRYLSIPGSATIAVESDGRLVLPPESVAMRTLSFGDRRVVTQLLSQRPDASWYAEAYVWKEDGSDAVLVDQPVTIDLGGGQSYRVDPTACTTCHVSPRSATIGLEIAQLDRDDVDYGGGRLGNPLATLEHLGMLASPPVYDATRRLARPDDFIPINRRARAQLHANCAFCHYGESAGALDLRYATPLAAAQACGVPGALPSGGGLRLAAGVPEESQIFTSMQALGPGQMPPVGRTTVDDRGAALVADWIRLLSRCP